jgi:hypothetical protein
MDLIGYYLLFAFSTSITACYFWFWPLLQKAKANGVTNALTRAPILSVVIYVVVTAIIAPVIVLPILIPSMGEKFAIGLERELTKQD